MAIKGEGYRQGRTMFSRQAGIELVNQPAEPRDRPSIAAKKDVLAKDAESAVLCFLRRHGLDYVEKCVEVGYTESGARLSVQVNVPGQEPDKLAKIRSEIAELVRNVYQQHADIHHRVGYVISVNDRRFAGCNRAA